MVSDTIKQTFDGAVERKNERIKKKGKKIPLARLSLLLTCGSACCAKCRGSWPISPLLSVACVSLLLSWIGLPHGERVGYFFFSLLFLGGWWLKRRRLIPTNIAIDVPLAPFAFSPNSTEWLKYLVVANHFFFFFCCHWITSLLIPSFCFMPLPPHCRTV